MRGPAESAAAAAGAPMPLEAVVPVDRLADDALAELAPSEQDELAHELVAQAAEQMARRELAAEAMRRVSRYLEDLDPGVFGPHMRRPPLQLHYPRWGWRRSIRHAVQRRMFTGQYLNLYRRYLTHRVRTTLRGQQVELRGMVFTGKRVEFHARRGHGRLTVGPWCWIGNDNKLRAHEGQLSLGPKVVMGRDNVINTYLDIEIGEATILADWIYVCDFDHRFDRLDVPIKDQGIVTSPVRIGPDVWVGEKASVLRGVDIGHGSIIASSALVRNDVPPFSIVGGVPGRVLKSRLPSGMDPEEALDLIRRGEAIPGDPIDG